jgi:predicted RND superfamily exporter protein
MLDGYAKWIVQRPWVVLVASLIIVALLSAGIGQLSFRSDDRIFFSDENPELSALKIFESKYGREDNIVFILSARNGDLFTPGRLAAINELTDRAWRMPDVKRVDSITNFQRVSAQGDEVIIDHLARSGDTLSERQARDLKEIAMREPLLLGRLLSSDAKVGLVAVQFRLTDDMQGDMAGALMQDARDIGLAFTEKHSDLELRISGSLALDNAFGEASAHDGAVLTPIMFVLIFGLIGLVFRSLSVVLSTLLVIIAAIGSAMGTAGYFYIPLSSPSVSAPFIILTLATADCIHLATAIFRVSRAHPEVENRAAVSQGLVDTFRPITMTSLTTAIGFFSLTFSESPPFGHLGIISGTGAIFAWLLTISLLPAMMTLLPWRHRTATLLIPDSWWYGLHRFIERRAALVAGSILIAGAGAAGFAATNVLDDRYVAYFDHGFDFRQDTDYLNQHLGGFYNLEFSLNSGNAEGISHPEYLRQVDAFAAWLRQQAGVTHVAALSDIMRTVNQGMNGGGEDAYLLPEDAGRAAQFLWLYEMSLPRGLDLREQVTVDKSESRMTVALEDLSTEQVLDLARRTKIWAEQNAPLLADSAQATGTTMLFSLIGQRNIEQMLTGTFLALLLISVILLLVFGSVWLGGIAIVSNLIPPLASLGGWALFVGEVGMAVATIAAVTLGIVVDDTIHFIEAAQRARRRGAADRSQAVLMAMLQAGPGIVITTVVLAAGFACLAFSGFQINAWMGLMTAVVICIAFIFDFLFLPSILIKLRRWT